MGVISKPNRMYGVRHSQNPWMNGFPMISYYPSRWANSIGHLCMARCFRGSTWAAKGSRSAPFSWDPTAAPGDRCFFFFHHALVICIHGYNTQCICIYNIYLSIYLSIHPSISLYIYVYIYIIVYHYASHGLFWKLPCAWKSGWLRQVVLGVSVEVILAKASCTWALE